MTATRSKPRRQAHSRRWNDKFLELLPAIQEQAEYAFRRLPVEAREELVQEVIVAAYGLFASLCRRGKSDRIYPAPITRFAVRRVRAGRRMGTSCSTRDVLSTCACPAKGFVVERLDRFDGRAGCWREVLVEDRTAGPAEIATTRLDFASWLLTLSNRDRRLAEKLACGETTGRVARLFRISAARVSQLRGELCENWQRFVGELAAASRPSMATA